MSWDLIADIGGTNMRLAAVSNQKISDQHTYPTVGKLSIYDATSEFVKRIGSNPRHAVIAAAGIVEDGSVTLTNTGSVITEDKINSVCGVENTKILNDFEAAAWSLADVGQDQLQCLQGSGELVQKPRVIVGPGTGLGVGALVWSQCQPVVVEGEGGHVGLSPDTAEEFEIFKTLVSAWPEVRMGDGFSVEAEAAVSGTGLPYLYSAVCAVFGSPLKVIGAGDIFATAKTGKDICAVKTIQIFTKHLGKVAGDMGVTFAAKGGVFLAGGVISSNPWIFGGSEFLSAFNGGGRHTEFRKKLPVFIYSTGQFGLNGAMSYLHFHE